MTWQSRWFRSSKPQAVSEPSLRNLQFSANETSQFSDEILKVANPRNGLRSPQKLASTYDSTYFRRICNWRDLRKTNLSAPKYAEFMKREYATTTLLVSLAGDPAFRELKQSLDETSTQLEDIL